MGMNGPKRPKKGKDQEVGMSCSDKGCAAYDSGGSSNVGQSKYKSKAPAGSKGAKNVVMQKGSRKEANWQKKLSKVKSVSNRSKF
jgi:hypothetical protein